MKITISGTLGSGKSTVAKLLAEKLNYKQYSAGGFTRKIAEERKITLAELTLLETKDPSIDAQVDKYQTELGNKEDNFILEARIGFHFVPDSVKIFLKCDEKIAAKRILKNLKEKNNSRMNEGLKENEREILKSIKIRREQENKRYSAYYEIKQDDESNFDIIIDTTNISPDEVCEKIIKFIQIKESRVNKKTNN